MDEFWKEFAQSLLLAFAPIIAGLIAGYIAVAIKRLWAKIQADKPELAYTLDTIARMAVQAAEQAKFHDYIDSKKTYAIEFVQNYLTAQGWGVIDVDVIKAAIEAAVFNEFDKDEVLAARAERHALPETPAEQ